jgi:hypothetical protein
LGIVILVYKVDKNLENYLLKSGFYIVTIILEPKKILKYLLLIILILFSANVIGLVNTFVFYDGRVFGFAYMFNFNASNSVPSLFTFIVFLLNALLLLAIGLKSKSHSERSFIWFGLSIFLCLLAIAKTTVLLRIVGYPIYSYLSNLPKSIMLLFILIAIAVLIYFMKELVVLLKRKPRYIQKGFFIAVATFVFGAIILDKVGQAVGIRYGEDSILYALSYSFEELMEMTGITMFLYTLAQYIKQKYTYLSISIQ